MLSVKCGYNTTPTAATTTTTTTTTTKTSTTTTTTTRGEPSPLLFLDPLVSLMLNTVPQSQQRTTHTVDRRLKAVISPSGSSCRSRFRLESSAPPSRPPCSQPLPHTAVQARKQTSDQDGFQRRSKTRAEFQVRVVKKDERKEGCARLCRQAKVVQDGTGKQGCARLC